MDVIRKFQDFDLKKVMRLWYEGNLEAHDFIDREYWDRNLSYVKRVIPEVEVYVYEINGQVVGFVGIDEGYIAGLFVDKEFRGCGVGTKLMDYVKERYDFFTLHVFENNYGAVTFYENRGLLKKEESVHEDLGEVEYLMYYRKKKKKA
ncbi:MAG: GNAT family N-acetyltransferase [Lachnospiraceae bacterium]|nr:GNAT family N-acetyltransferase [Lachnospiraceae bacterium]